MCCLLKGQPPELAPNPCTEGLLCALCSFKVGQRCLATNHQAQGFGSNSSTWQLLACRSACGSGALMAASLLMHRLQAQAHVQQAEAQQRLATGEV